jgi:hypothetical protein
LPESAAGGTIAGLKEFRSQHRIFGTMTGNNGDRRAELAADIRRQFGSEATMRFLRTLPAFRLESDIPEHFRELLDRLDGIEASMASGERR